MSAALLLAVRPRPRPGTAAALTPWGPAAPATATGATGPGAARAAAAPRLGAQIDEGLVWLWRHPRLRALALLTGLTNLCTEATLSVLVVFSTQELHLSDTGFGYLLAVAAVGGVAGSAVAPWLSRLIGQRDVLLVVLALQAATQAAIFLTASTVAVAVALAFAALGIVMWNVVTISWRQALVPDHLMGRVNSVYRFVAWGTIPVGAMAGGFVAAAIGTRGLFGVSAAALAGVLVLAVRLLCEPGRHRRRGARPGSRRRSPHCGRHRGRPTTRMQENG